VIDPIEAREEIPGQGKARVKSGRLEILRRGFLRSQPQRGHQQSRESSQMMNEDRGMKIRTAHPFLGSIARFSILAHR
jgi:hypothetical protein